MSQFTIESDGSGPGTRLKRDGMQVEHVRSVNFRIADDEFAQIEVEYRAEPFEINTDAAHFHCIGTDLAESDERAVLAYLKDKYE
ncbi:MULTISPECIES: hypothetical protein [unclassified Halomonas]|uniref:hypothetical protein n=1 Tax=unclassified Halomonas TaxID=2609666 RepID=UPI002076ABBD|nr:MULTISPECIES: hypothetical protein [unclassified Halomonas]